MRTCHFACAKRLPKRSSSPSGALRTAPNADYSRLPERSAWKKNFTRVDKFLLTWQVSRASDDGAAAWTGGARLGQRSGTVPTIFALADVAALAWSSAAAKLLDHVFVIAAACGGARGRSWGLRSWDVHDLPSCAARNRGSLTPRRHRREMSLPAKVPQPCAVSKKSAM